MFHDINVGGTGAQVKLSGVSSDYKSIGWKRYLGVDGKEVT